MYVVFARKYRPGGFADVVGQQHVTRTLQNAVRTGRVAHAYLFCGSRGVGKTTVARILAKALNCAEGPTPEPCGECDSCRRIAAGNDIDVMEIDGASNRGIDEVRELRQNVGLSPARSRFKIYYIDEVHMLTGPAFNALLKTLEEPPAHVKFIFSTTDPQRLPETVKSRCQRFDFHRIPDDAVVDFLQQVCREEELQVEEGGLVAIARAARGSMRDALGTLDQLATFGDEVTLDDVLAVLGAVSGRVLTELVDALAAEDTAGALNSLNEVLSGGTAIEDFARQFSEYLRDLLVASYSGVDSPLLAGPAADMETLARQTEAFSSEQLLYMIQLLREASLRARRETTGRLALELAVIKMSRLSELVPVQEALRQLRSGEFPPGEPEPARAERRASRPAITAPSGDGASNSHAGGALERMRQKLNSAVKKPAAPKPPDAALPEGMDEAKYRRLAACADGPELAREALEDKPLMEAFLKADAVLGLHPERLQRRETPTGDDAENDEDQLSEQE